MNTTDATRTITAGELTEGMVVVNTKTGSTRTVREVADWKRYTNEDGITRQTVSFTKGATVHYPITREIVVQA